MMPALARADLESLLRARQLDRTLTTALPDPPPQADPSVLAPTGVAALDARLGGGLPRGQLSEITGPRSAGRASLAVRLLAEAASRGEMVALVDALDMFDPPSAEAAGLALDRLLWVRGHVAANPGLCRDTNQRALEQAIRALALVLQSGTCGVVVFDAAEAPAPALARLPFTTWLRLQRLVEGSPTAVVLVGGVPMARSAAGVSVKLGNREPGTGGREPGTGDQGTGGRGAERFDGNLFDGLDVHIRIVQARARVQRDVPVRIATTAVHCA